MNTVVITGANRGIGLGFCSHYLQAGWRVIALSRLKPDPSDLAVFKDQESCFHHIEVDLSCKESILSMLDKTTLITHSIELLINNAGVAEHENFGQWTQQAFINNFTINAVAPALLIQTLSPLLVRSSKVIQLSSGLASLHENLSPLESFDSYSMSKTALNMMTRRLSVKLIEREVAVYSISPGWVQTRMGGEEASSNVTDAVKILTSTIENLSLTESGSFFDEHGNKLAW